MILIKSQVHLPQHKIGLIEFQTLHLFCRAEMLSSLLLFKIGLNLIYSDIYVYIYHIYAIVICMCYYQYIYITVVPPYLWGIRSKTPRGC